MTESASIPQEGKLKTNGFPEAGTPARLRAPELGRGALRGVVAPPAPSEGVLKGSALRATAEPPTLPGRRLKTNFPEASAPTPMRVWETESGRGNLAIARGLAYDILAEAAQQGFTGMRWLKSGVPREVIAVETFTNRLTTSPISRTVAVVKHPAAPAERLKYGGQLIDLYQLGHSLTEQIEEGRITDMQTPTVGGGQVFVPTIEREAYVSGAADTMSFVAAEV